MKFVSLEKKDGWRKEINHLGDYNRWGEKDVNRTRGVLGVREKRVGDLMEMMEEKSTKIMCWYFLFFFLFLLFL